MSKTPHTEYYTELIIGLVSAVGTESDRFIGLLREQFGKAGYQVEVIKVSKDVIPLTCPGCVTKSSKHYDRIKNLMELGNRARKNSDDNSILAKGVAAQIGGRRYKQFNRPAPFDKTVFIVDSLKRPEEVEQLRLIYPSGFVLVGLHSEKASRLEYLTSSLSIAPGDVDFLMETDRDEEGDSFGQRVNKTFHLADFFVKLTSSHNQLRCDVKRMVELWFGCPFHTPTFDEYAMFLAFAASLRSADLSRQVGAVIARDSHILATGANECPAPGGGLYWAERMGEHGCIGDAPNGRDYKREAGDSNKAEQNKMIDKMINTAEKDYPTLDRVILRQLLEKSTIQDLTEYGRVVHAEMEALLSCSRMSQSTLGATLYTTTFPCHNCAKHIIAGGVSRVVYVEPYPKSKALEFHNDSITEDDKVWKDKKDRKGLVLFEPFVGIGPRRFFDLFSMRLGSTYPLVRKNPQNGKPVDWSINRGFLRLQLRPTSYLETELDAYNQFITSLPQDDGVAL